MARVLFILVVAFGIVQCKLLRSCNITKRFVDKHNERRLLLARGQVSGQPAAAKMTKLVWDNELATKAQDWASKNQYAHNSDKTIPSGRFTIGENIYKYSTTSTKVKVDWVELAVKKWWDEYKDYTYGKLSPATFAGPKQVGHYTQIAWAKSIKLGCGASQYQANGWTNIFVVCDYGPAGNVIGQTPYDAGRPSGQLVCGDSNCTKMYGINC